MAPSSSSSSATPSPPAQQQGATASSSWRIRRSSKCATAVAAVGCLCLGLATAFHPLPTPFLGGARRRPLQLDEPFRTARVLSMSGAVTRPSSPPSRNFDDSGGGGGNREGGGGGGGYQGGQGGYQGGQGQRRNLNSYDGGGGRTGYQGGGGGGGGGYQGQRPQYNNNGGGGGQRRGPSTGGGGGGWNGGGGSYTNNNDRGDAILLKGAKLLIKALPPRPPREGGYDRGGGGGGGGGRFERRDGGGGGGGDRGSYAPRGGGGGDRGSFAPRGGPRRDSGGVVIPAILPADLEAAEAARRKKEKEKLKKGGKYAEEGAVAAKGRGKGVKGKGGFDDDVDALLEGAKGSRFKKKGKKRGYVEEVQRGPSVVVVDEPTLTIAQLAERMDERAGEIIKYLMVNMGVMATITQSIDADTAIAVAEAFGKKTSRQREEGDDGEGGEEEPSVLTDGLGFEEDDPSTLLPRAPVVTIMGHVDHGKTSLLDAIRETSVVSGEAGGITQHIGAYQVKRNDRLITFIDTPGHAAFSEMRARGANVTDLVVLVVAADEGIKEQTVDSIRCAKSAGVPILVAVNKVDKPGAEPQRVLTELMKYDVLMEEFGGDVLSAEVSAKKRLNLEGLLEKILLQAEILDLKANPDRAAQGAVVESRMEKGLGPVTTVLVQRGTLKVGDCIVAGSAYGKVRSLADERGKRIEMAGPSVPAVLSGWDGVPSAGDTLIVVENEMSARNLAEARRRLERERTGSATMGSMQAQVLSIFGGEGVKKREEVTVVIKTDVQGSAEAIATALGAIKAEDDRAEVVVKVLSSGVGDVTQSDVALAGVSKATILAFNVAADMQAQEDARKTGVEIEYHNVIYDILDKLEAKVKEILSPTPDGEYSGTAVIKQIFEIGKVGKVAGCEVTDGMMKKGGTVRVLRGTEIVYKGPLRTLRNVKSDVQEMNAGQECGMSFKDFEDFRLDDVIECYVVEKTKKAPTQ